MSDDTTNNGDMPTVAPIVEEEGTQVTPPPMDTPMPEAPAVEEMPAAEPAPAADATPTV